MTLAAFNPFATPAGAYATTLGVSIVSGLVPLVNIEAYLLGVALLTPVAGWPVVFITTLGQMIAKVILYELGRRGLRPRGGRFSDRLEKAEKAFRRHPVWPDVVVLTSAVTGLPPFYGVSVAAGVTRIPLWRFLLIATPARLARFAVVFFAPHLLMDRG